MIPFEYLFLNLDAVVLAYLIIDDGSSDPSGIVIHTENYTWIEVYKLAGLFHYLFNIEATVQNHNGQPMLYIKSKSINRLRELVIPYILPMFS